MTSTPRTGYTGSVKHLWFLIAQRPIPKQKAA